MKLKLKNTSGESVTLIIKPDDTFIDLRERVADELGLRLDLSDIVNGEHYLETQRVLDFFSQLPHAEDEALVGNCLFNVECIVPGCNKTMRSHPENSFFEFPNEEIRNHQWALYCQRLLGESGKKRLNITPNSRICSDHFKPEQFVKNAATILKKTAVPCINPEVGPKFLNFNTQLILNELSDSSTNLLSSGIADSFPTNDLDSSSSLIQLNKDKLPLCRLCAKYTNNCVYVFNDSEQSHSLLHKIHACLPVNIDIADSLPKQVCSQCCLYVEKCYTFSESAIEAHMKLRNKKSVNLSGLSIIAVSTDNSEESAEGLSLLTDFSNGNLNELQNMCKFCQGGKMGHTCLAFSDSVASVHASELEETDMRNYNLSGKNNDLITYDLDNVSIGNGLVNVKSDEKIKPLTNINGECLPVKLRIESRTGKSPSSGSNWEAADNAFGYSCMLCSADFRSSADLFPHSLMHSEDGNYVCCLCNYSCTHKNELAIHFKTHSVLTSAMVYQCDNCGIGFRSLSMFEIHNCTTINWTLNRCNICHKTFRSESRLEFHKKFHENGSKPGQCELCPKTFSDEIKLYKHVTYLHGHGKERKNHCCEECGKVFRSVSSLKYHQRIHQGESFLKPYSCDVCGKSFIRRSMLRNHITTRHKTLSAETKCFMCKVCYEIFPYNGAVTIHLERLHSLINCEISFESYTTNKVYTCEFCKRCFATPAHINNHRNKHRNDSPYECKHCLTEFPSNRELEAHSVSDHSESISKEYEHDFTIPFMFLCEYCDRSFVSSLKYTEHLTVHYGPTPYLCRFCDEKFSNLDELLTHRSSQHANHELDNSETNYYRPYECHYCNKSFAIEDALIKHIRMHTGEKPFICDQCGKGFSQSSGLYTHQKVHSTERPYTCSICPRRFKIKGDRDIHVRKHSGERPYKCEFCGKAFMTQHVYSQHRKIHTGERPYKCDVCHISFRRSHVLTVHKRIHTGEKPNSCDICGKRYRQKGDMLKHKRIQHELNNTSSVALEHLL